jgi:DMSO reductase family type II enzyme chaperone
MMDQDHDVAFALRRAAVYRVVGLALAYPTRPRLEAIAADSPYAGSSASAEVAGALDRLAAAARAADVASLAAEHVALFQRGVRCPPYEGAYGPRGLAGKAAMLADVAGFYRAFGLEPAAAQPETEDHIGAELEFMSALALKEAWALAEEDQAGLEVTRAAARTFLADHLGRWARAFAERLQAEAASAVLTATAALVVAWIDAECGRLQLTPPPLEGVQAGEETPFTCPMTPEAAS